MTSTITINNDHQINTPISLLIQMPSIIIQIPLNHQFINGFHASCNNCRHNCSLLINDKKQAVEVDEKIINIKDEIEDIKPKVSYLKEEKHYPMFDIDERLLDNNANVDARLFSPISITNSSDTENKQVYVPDDHDGDYNFMIKQSFQDTSEIIEYLKQDLMN